METPQRRVALKKTDDEERSIHFKTILLATFDERDCSLTLAAELPTHARNNSYPSSRLLRATNSALRCFKSLSHSRSWESGP